jgi:hypothetical protein
MRPSLHHPTRPALPFAAHVAAAGIAGACAALLLAACAPDVGVGPVGPSLEAPLAEAPPPLAQCEEQQLARQAVLEMTGVDPLCVAPDEQPTLWREHFAWRVPAECGCPVVTP